MLGSKVVNLHDGWPRAYITNPTRTLKLGVGGITLPNDVLSIIKSKRDELPDMEHHRAFLIERYTLLERDEIVQARILLVHLTIKEMGRALRVHFLKVRLGLPEFEPWQLIPGNWFSKIEHHHREWIDQATYEESYFDYYKRARVLRIFRTSTTSSPRP